MKHLILLLLLLLAIAPPVHAETVTLPSTDRLPGVDLAEGFSQITETAISPLWGVCVFGCWKWNHTDPALRDRLPITCQPAVWGTGLAVLLLCLLKDVLGTAAPAFLKKPLDMLELFENKASALVASSSMLPFVTSQVSRHLTDATASRNVHLPHIAMVPIGSVAAISMQVILMAAALLTFGAVWITFHALHVLISLSPFGFVDAALKLCKTALLSIMVIATWINPWLGACIAVVVVAAAFVIAPRAFRFAVFGTLVAWDVLLPWRANRHATPASPRGFLARPAQGAPSRSYGRVIPGADGALCFQYRPWLLLPVRTVAIAPPDELAVEKGIIYPSLIDDRSAVVHLLPRYGRQPEAIARSLGIPTIVECAVRRGFAAARAWLIDTLQLGWKRAREGGTA